MMRPVSARSVCSSGLSPTTVTDSSMAPTSIFRSTRMRRVDRHDRCRRGQSS